MFDALSASGSIGIDSLDGAKYHLLIDHNRFINTTGTGIYFHSTTDYQYTIHDNVFNGGAFTSPAIGSLTSSRISDNIVD